jgi:hypothetical protein
MNTTESTEDWLRMFKTLSDPEEREKAKRKHDREKRREEKVADTGL